MNDSLASYAYFASRIALVSLIPAAMYWLISGFGMAFKVFAVFFIIGQLAAAWTYRKRLFEAWRNRSQR
jgi:hypothetical protein